YRHDNVDFVAKTEEDLLFDETLAKIATKLAMNRHVGKIKVAYTPLGDVYNQYGKDLLETKFLIGTGGILVNSNNYEAILKEGLFSKQEPTLLKPQNPKICLDKSYILSSMGLLAFEYPEI